MCDVDHTHVGVKVRALDDAPLNDYLSAGPINTNGSATPQVFAWDTSKNAPDEDEDDGRSYISAVSEVITDSSEKCNGRAKNEMGERGWTSRTAKWHTLDSTTARATALRGRWGASI